MGGRMGGRGFGDFLKLHLLLVHVLCILEDLVPTKYGLSLSLGVLLS